MLMGSPIKEFLEQINWVSSLVTGLYLLLILLLLLLLYLLGVLCRNKAWSFARSATIPGGFFEKDLLKPKSAE